MSQHNCYQIIHLNKKSNKQNIKKQKIVYANYTILSSVKKNKITEIISIIFLNLCNIDVYGYNIIYDEFWGKKCDKLYFRLKIIENDDLLTSIIINPIIGYEDDIKIIYNGIKDGISIYENTFI